MKNLDTKFIIIAVILIGLSIVLFRFWNTIAPSIMRILNSDLLTFGIWSLLVVTSWMHYHRNKEIEQNPISDKKGLERPIDYISFITTIGAIGTTIQVLGKELFAYYNFPSMCKTTNFNGLDMVSFGIAIAVLILYSYGKMIPVIEETYTKRNKINSIPEKEKV
jgi:hypothetical protein